jgi:hypothetical protein
MGSESSRLLYTSEEPFLTLWTDMETSHEEEDKVVANDICKVRHLEVLVRGSQGRGSAGPQAASENDDDDIWG